MINRRECWVLGAGVTRITAGGTVPSEPRPFGMRHAHRISAEIRDDLSLLTYDPEAQLAVLAHPSGDPEMDRRILADATTSTRATDKDGVGPSTPKDFETDRD
jgi:hypothetical protein